ncbi:MAG: hypothetical protein U0794_09430 [Isosphaeraceae bacterium]
MLRLGPRSRRPSRFTLGARSVHSPGGWRPDPLTLVEKGARGASHDITPPGRDVWRPAIARDGRGRIIVAWSEFRDGDFELYSRTFDPVSKTLGDEARLTSEAGSDADLALATAADGSVHLAWQRWRDGSAEIALGRLEGGRLVGARAVSRTAANDWSPALAADTKGNLWLAFDTYETGNYDVRLIQVRPDGSQAEPVTVGGTTRYEAHPSLGTDSRGRVWIAYEERTDNWGKDAENLVTGEGSTLYRSSTVRVRCLDGERLLDAGQPVVPKRDGAGLEAMNSFPRLTVDAADRVWLAFRHRQEAIWGNNLVMVVGGVWVEYLTTLAAGGWSPLQPLPASDGLLDNRPALVASPSNAPGASGTLLAVYSSDGRLRREVEHQADLTPTYYSHSGTPPGVVDNDLFASRVEVPAASGPAPTLTLVTGNEPDARPASPVHPNEAADVARLRAYRIPAGGSTYQLLRGEFHRHTELSQDGGSDGTLEDMWRYAIDVAAFDWLGNGDHDNGGGKEYTWWLVQKTTDLYHSPRFTSMFTYERSVSYPHGHRNVMFDRRGIRTLPRLVEAGKVVDADTPMLYDYLKELGGLCASHTSATGMGTDWRDMNPTYEPMVEIFQGHRQSYEHLGAPRGARRPGESIGGWQPLGMIWNALAMQYRIGFQASSDHISTHISYAVAIAEEPTRKGVLEAFRKRHCYGATDNIVLDVRTADGLHIMGDEFDTPADGSPIRLKVAIQGTAPIARVDVIKDFVYVYSTEPKTAQVAFEWTDNETRGPGLSWYYVRAIQTDGEIAWGSPMWVRSPNRPAAR